jgi:predicted MPP superfamily phosphohydrolase
MTALLVILALLAASGHVAMSVYLNNRLHAQGWPRGLTKVLSAASHTLTPVGAVAVAWACIVWLPGVAGAGSASAAWWLLAAYVAVCGLVALGPLPLSLWQRRAYRPPAALLSNHSTLLDLSQEPEAGGLVGPGWRRWLVRLPGNEVLRVEINEKRLALPRLDPALEGLSIVHLSDLHFTGAIGRRFFERAVERANAMEPDFVAITGDLLDKTACIDWVPYTLGRLRARHGAFFVLGNHDLRVDWRRLRETLEDSGVVDLGGRSLVAQVNGRSVLLAGNELPWFSPAPSAPGEEGDEPCALRILLSHSPDQIDWARRHGFDLLLAGHNHGGQICLPVVGPVFSPSRYGVRYAAGVFERPPTLMHVSRGLSGKTPVRYGCPPELTRLVLTRAIGQSFASGVESRPGG